MQDIFAQDFEAIQAHELEIAKQMALNGRQYVLDHFSWDVVVKKYCDLFETIEQQTN